MLDDLILVLSAGAPWLAVAVFYVVFIYEERGEKEWKFLK